MKKLLLLLAAAGMLFAASASFGQSTNEIEWLGQIDKKQTVTYGDAVDMFMFQTGKKPSSFENDSAALVSDGFGLAGYTQESPLTRGMLAKMTAKYLDLGGSFMYIFLKTERYAWKACIANGIFPEEGSSTDKMSGAAMLEVFSKISDIKGGEK